MQLCGKRSLPLGLRMVLRIDIGKPSREPMLWIPDQVVGAVGDAETGDSEWIEPLRPMLARIDIRLYTTRRQVPSIRRGSRPLTSHLPAGRGCWHATRSGPTCQG